jgi:hypothetical protein
VHSIKDYLGTCSQTNITDNNAPATTATVPAFTPPFHVEVP